MIIRPVLIAVLLTQLFLASRPSVAAVPGCPTLLQPIPSPGAAIFEGPIPPALVTTLFNLAYNAWAQRIGQPDIVIRSDTNAWRKVPEFVELIRLGKLYLPYLRQKLQAGDFRAVVAIECITGISSVLLYPQTMPAPGTFGTQDVANLWLMNGGQLIENQCRAACSANAACEQKCADDRQQYWGP
jgi:hypothetical protein